MEILSIKARLQEIEKEISDSSLGEEHIMREFAQIFESTTTWTRVILRPCRIKCTPSIFRVNLPMMAARFLLSGLPLEILDEVVSQIPITWIKTYSKKLPRLSMSIERCTLSPYWESKVV